MVNPIVALGDPNFQNVLAEKLAGVGRGFKFDKTVEKIEELQRAVQEMQANITLPGFKTTDLFDSILGLSGTVGVTDPATGRSSFVEQTLREQLQVQSRDSLSDEEDTEEDEDEQKGLGNIAFLYQLAKPDPTDPEDAITTPELPLGFMAKMDRYANRAKDLRQDPDKVKPGEELDAVRLSTIHKVKGAQWKNVYVQMPAKKFPMEPRVKPGEEPPPEEETLAERETERRLAYVALTRAISHLTVICPDQVGGKQAGVSVFVKESDLKLGENVPKPVADPPIDLSPEVQGEDKTASEDDYLVPYEWVN
jgi:superfamily I DNA/RNA helicase